MKWPWTKKPTIPPAMQDQARYAGAIQDEVLERLRRLSLDGDRSVRDADQILCSLERIEESVMRIELAVKVLAASLKPKPEPVEHQTQPYVAGQSISRKKKK